MPRPTKGPRLGGSPQHERHMLANLATQLFLHESIKTTEARARRLRPYAEKLITKGKRGDLHARRTVMKKVTDKYAVYRLFEELAPQFEGREGGYTRIVKTAPRKGDNAPMAVISLVLEPVAKKEIVDDAVATAKRAAAEAVKAEEPAAEADEAEEAAEDVKAEEPAAEPAPAAAAAPPQMGACRPAAPRGADRTPLRGSGPPGNSRGPALPPPYGAPPGGRVTVDITVGPPPPCAGGRTPPRMPPGTALRRVCKAIRRGP